MLAAPRPTFRYLAQDVVANRGGRRVVVSGFVGCEKDFSVIFGKLKYVFYTTRNIPNLRDGSSHERAPRGTTPLSPPPKEGKRKRGPAVMSPPSDVVGDATSLRFHVSASVAKLEAATWKK